MCERYHDEVCRRQRTLMTKIVWHDRNSRNSVCNLGIWRRDVVNCVMGRTKWDKWPDKEEWEAKRELVISRLWRAELGGPAAVLWSERTRLQQAKWRASTTEMKESTTNTWQDVGDHTSLEDSFCKLLENQSIFIYLLNVFWSKLTINYYFSESWLFKNFNRFKLIYFFVPETSGIF